MSRDEYKKYRDLNLLLKFAYTISDRDLRIRAVANIQAEMAHMIGEN